MTQPAAPAPKLSTGAVNAAPVFRIVTMADGVRFVYRNGIPAAQIVRVTGARWDAVSADGLWGGGFPRYRAAKDAVIAFLNRPDEEGVRRRALAAIESAILAVMSSAQAYRAPAAVSVLEALDAAGLEIREKGK